MSYDADDWFKAVEDSTHAEAFANRLRRYLQVVSKSRHQYGLKEGKLVNSSLHRVAVQIPGYSERVFKKVVKSNTLDISISLLIDMSGSMSGTKYAHACKAAALMQHALGNVLRLPVEVLGFSTYTASGARDLPRHFIFRKFGDQFVSDKDMMSRLSEAAGESMRNNLDGDAVMWAYNRVKVQKTKRKLLVVFSDGSPAAHSGGGDIVEHLESVTKAIEKTKVVDLIGVGILDDNVERYYKQHIVIHKVKELEIKLLDLLRRKIVA